MSDRGIRIIEAALLMIVIGGVVIYAFQQLFQTSTNGIPVPTAQVITLVIGLIVLIAMIFFFIYWLIKRRK